MVRFGIICLKLNHGPNISMLIWNMVGFEISSVPNLTMFQMDIPSWICDMVSFRTWIFQFRFGKFEIKILIWECPKSDSEQSYVWSTTELSNVSSKHSVLSLSPVNQESSIVGAGSRPRSERLRPDRNE